MNYIEVWERSIRVNLTGTFLVNKVFIGEFGNDGK